MQVGCPCSSTNTSLLLPPPTQVCQSATAHCAGHYGDLVPGDSGLHSPGSHACGPTAEGNHPHTVQVSAAAVVESTPSLTLAFPSASPQASPAVPASPQSLSHLPCKTRVSYFLRYCGDGQIPDHFVVGQTTAPPLASMLGGPSPSSLPAETFVSVDADSLQVLLGFALAHGGVNPIMDCLHILLGEGVLY